MTKKEVEKRLKTRLNLPVVDSTLTRAEEEVLNLITKEFLTLKQICCRRNCSNKAVYKIIKNLKKKGVLNQGLQEVEKIRCYSQPNRLHGQEINIKILNKSQKYQDLLKKCNLVIKDGHTIRLYNNSIEIYSGEGISFLGRDEQEATSKSLVYWKKFIVGLENDYRVILIKNRSQNIRIVNSHYAYTNSEICKNAIENKKLIKVYADEDGKLCFITDDSFGLMEDETLHPITSKQDREAINNFINDLRRNPTNFSEVLQAINGLVQVQIMNAENIVTHFKVLNDINKTLFDLKEEIKKLNSPNGGLEE